VADWVVISSLATAGGTLALAGTTYASVRSANRAARAAEASMLASLRPLLVPSRLDDPRQKIHFVEGNSLVVLGGGGAAESTDEAVYLGISLRNVGSGIGVLHGWHLYPERRLESGVREEEEEFTRLSRDLYLPPGDIGFWQGAFRDPSSPEFAAAREAIEARSDLTVDILYGDHEGGQRVITRFILWPRPDGNGWLAGASRHWNLDREDPR
jgi:hypothetical protein